MTILRADVVMPYETHLPKDVSINTFHFFAAGDQVDADYESIVDSLQSFYADVHTPGTASISTLLSDYIDRALTHVNIYDVDVEGPPIWTGDLTFDNAAVTTSLPFEVAVCASYSAHPVPGSIQRRRRGRIYIGPLTSAVMTTSSGNPSVPPSSTRNALAGGCTYLAGGGVLEDGIFWGVYSRINGTIAEIDMGFVDDEFDTQRRRQVEATTRTSWTTLV